MIGVYEAGWGLTVFLKMMSLYFRERGKTRERQNGKKVKKMEKRRRVKGVGLVGMGKRDGGGDM